MEKDEGDRRPQGYAGPRQGSYFFCFFSLSATNHFGAQFIFTVRERLVFPVLRGRKGQLHGSCRTFQVTAAMMRKLTDEREN